MRLNSPIVLTKYDKVIVRWTRFSICLLFFITWICSTTKANEIDSLKNALTKINQKKIKLYFKLGKSLLKKQPASTRDYMLQIVAFENIEKTKYYIEALGYIGKIHHLFGDYFIALDYQRKRLEQAEKRQDTLQIIRAMSDMASDYLAIDHKQEASEYWTKSLFLSERIKDKNSIAIISLKLVEYYQVLGEYHIALKYLNKLEQSQLSSNSIYLMIATLQKGSIYIDQQQYTKAYTLTQKAYNYFHREPNSLWLAKVYQNLGIIQKYYAKYELAGSYLDSALYIATSRRSHELKSTIYQSFVDLYEVQGNTEKVLYYHKKLAKAKEKFYTERRAKYMADLYTKYKANKKEKEILLLKKNALLKTSELKRRNITNYFLWVGLLLILVLLVLIAVYARFKIKANVKLRNKNAHIEAQKEEIHVQKEHIENKNELLENVNRKITDSIRYAQTIQNAMLPRETDFQNIFRHSFVSFLPKDIVSGDFYWITSLQDKTLVAVADCTGHGVPGAFMALIGINLLDDILYSLKSPNPAQILTELDKRVREVLKQEEKMNDDGMDITLCCLEETNEQHRKVVWSGAKHSLLYISQEMTKLQVARGTNKAIGGFIQKQNKVFANHTLLLPLQSMLYLTTDGFTDQKDYTRKKYGSLRFRELLAEISSLSVKIQKQILEDEFKNHKGEEEQIDDMTIVGIRLS